MVKLKRLLLPGLFLLVLLLPGVGSILKWGGLPPGFGLFPPEKVLPEPNFELAYFVGIAIGGAIMVLLVLFPNWFGFTIPKAGSPDFKGIISYPKWFWIGLFLCIGIYLWIGNWPDFLDSIVPFLFFPFWLGFILILDGFVFVRTGGKSLIARRPFAMLRISLLSILVWYMVEFLNYFVMENWYYPVKAIQPLWVVIPVLTLGFSVILPCLFEWLTLLYSFTFLRDRYKEGPKFHAGKKTVFFIFLIGLFVCFAFGYWPYRLFFGIWLGPLLVLVSGSSLLGYKTVLDPLKEGNWSPILLMGLAAIFHGVVWEAWNSFTYPYFPNHWKYDLAYANILHIYEMPILGYFGYMPFGLFAWTVWHGLSQYIGWNPKLTPDITPK